MKTNLIIVLSLVFIANIKTAFSATCSCAGIPLNGTLNQTNLDKGTWQAKINYNFIDLSDLVQGSDEINDETNRQRESTSYIVQLSYGLTDKWTITALGSYIEHYRNIEAENNPTESSAGLGDSILAATFSPFTITPFNKYELSLGIGQKFTSGESANEQNGITYIEDMQPSTGAPSTYFWLYTARALSQAAKHTIHSSINYTQNKINDRDYKFGDETNISIGYHFQSDTPWASSITVSLQDSDAHTRFGFEVPNTGGRWTNLTPAIQYSFQKNLATQLSIQIPIKRELKGALQFTTRFSIDLGVSYQW